MADNLLLASTAGPQPTMRPHIGFVPLRLTLSGFKGVRSGLGRPTVTIDLEALPDDAQLVAFVGANGRGKTTVMDNLHPYLLMPSRAGGDGLGSFSYYDHVYLPESEKILEWAHGGRRYKTHLVFRVNGKRRTEAFLFVRTPALPWAPVSLIDGTPVDGKVEVYDRAIEEILGPADTFFTSAFSAQNKRSLSAYRTGEIKALLADLLGLDAIRAVGARAAETTRLLKAGLAVVRQEQVQVTQIVTRLQPECIDPAVVAAATREAQARQHAANDALSAARADLTLIEADVNAAAGIEQQRHALVAERAESAGRYKAEAQRLEDRHARLNARADVLARRMAARRQTHQQRRDGLLARRRQLERTAAMAPLIDRAERTLVKATRILQLRSERTAAAQSLVDHRDELRGRLALLDQQQAAMETEAGQLVLRQTDLVRRLGLAAQVPCAGLPLQGACQLLHDAREAKTLHPGVDAQIGALSDRRSACRQQRQEIAQALRALAAVDAQRNRAEHREERARTRLTGLHLLMARQGDAEQAVSSIRNIDVELAELGAEAVDETDDERAERAEITATHTELLKEAERLETGRQADNRRIEEALARLPAPASAERLHALRRAEQQRARQVAEADDAALSAVRAQERQAALQLQLAEAERALLHAKQRSREVEGELAQWNLLTRGLSNDGVIALDIDDAGPMLATLANDLLMACYGPRFSLEVVTQSATAKGELREDFDIVVHDGLRGESKSLKLVSGGERVWINECMTRAIALYLADNPGRQFATLFCDEADGPLDPAHKRMFMGMKREVLRLGGYAREYYVSQTPELTAMADAVIDLDALVVTNDVSH